MKENKETDMFGNEVRADDTICVIIPCVFPDSPNAKIAECSVFLDTDKNRLAYCYPDDKNMIYAIRWNRERFWLKGCSQMQSPHPTCATCIHKRCFSDKCFCSNVETKLPFSSLGLATIKDTNKDYCSNHETNKD